MPDPTYRAALEMLRQHTRSGPTRSLVSLLVRATAVSRPAAHVLMNSELRTRQQRREAIITAAAAIAAAADEKKEAG